MNHRIDLIAILIGVIFFVVSVMPTLLIIMLYLLSDLRQDFESKREIPKDKEMCELIELFIGSHTNIRDLGDDVFKNRLNDVCNEFKIAISDLKNGHIVFEDTERWENLILNITRSLEYGDTLKATSLVFIPKWWDSDFGRKYLEENRNAANKKVEITRLFFLDDINKMEDYAKEIIKHSEAKVKVRIINMVDLYPAQIEDFLIAGEKYVVHLDLYKGKVKRVHVYNTQIEIDRANGLFSDLNMRSKGLEKFKEFDDYLSDKDDGAEVKRVPPTPEDSA